MWNEIKNTEDIKSFMNQMIYFHDSCVKELRYISGAYVENNLSMYPINQSNTLYIVVQRQFKDMSVVEMKFSGLKELRLNPLSEKHTCEIFQASLLFVDDDICWCDSEDWEDADSLDYDGIAVRASSMCWRVVEDALGSDEFYRPKDSCGQIVTSEKFCCSENGGDGR